MNHHASSCQNQVIRDVLCNKFYVDNMICSSDDMQSLIKTGKDVQESLDQVGFHLREWNSNCLNIVREFDETIEKLYTCKILGYVFHPDSDLISMKTSSLHQLCTTKRGIVSTVGKIFDSIGLVTSLLIKCKSFIRNLCREKYTWDELLPLAVQEEWKKISSEFNEAMCDRYISINRYMVSSNKPANLVVFTDASKIAYSFAMYCVQNNKSSLLFSKSKLTPYPSKTLPSLELLAIYLAVQCSVTLLANKNFPVSISHITFLTDSQVALSWVISNKIVKRNVFVSNRLKDINLYKERLIKLGTSCSFSYVPSQHNIADIVTRPPSPSMFGKSTLIWYEGPSWITLPASNWPTGSLGCLPVPFKGKQEICDCSPLEMPVQEVLARLLLEIKKFSSYSRLFGATVKLFEAVNKFKKDDLSLGNIKKKSFSYLINIMQLECLEEEIKFLQSDIKSYDLAPKLVKTLNLFLDAEGLVRSQGRINKNVLLSFNAVNPILISNKHHLCTLLINNAHFCCKHLGVESTINHLRHSGFWIINARQAVKRVLKQCIVCHKYNSRPFSKSPTPFLPSERVNLVKPFYHTGLDFTGHFFVTDYSNNRHKVYILLFTCMNTRAVHLEMVNSMTVEDFVLAFVRFNNRYGTPRVLYSDNAKTFISGAALLKDLIGSDFFQQHFLTYHIEHKTIPAYSSWFGSSWERLIKTIKQCLYKTVGRNIVSETSFSTVFSHIQRTINSRPLTYRESDNDINVVTPNHLLCTTSAWPSIIISEENLDDELGEDEIKESLLNSLCLRDVLVSRFRNRWYLDYLLSLRSQHKDSFCISELHHKNNFLKIGAVVLIKHAIRPRPFWSLGKIIEIKEGEDGLVRVVNVLRSDHSVLTTSVNNLYPLGLDSEELRDGKNITEDNSSNVDPVNVSLTENANMDCVNIDTDEISDIDHVNSSFKENDKLEDLADDPIIDETASSSEEEIVTSFENAIPRDKRLAALKFRQNLEQWIKDNQV